MSGSGNLPFFLEYRAAAAFCLDLALLALHFARERFFRSGTRAKYLYFVALAVLAAGAGIRIVFFARATTIDFFDMTVWTVTYAILLFIALCEVLLAGGARKLTAWRGSNWVKELDYWYLGFGVIGLAWTINRMELVSQKIHGTDFAGPYVVATALVVRAIKTRTEINKWNEFGAEMASSSAVRQDPDPDASM